jgi:hypothetical protein
MAQMNSELSLEVDDDEDCEFGSVQPEDDCKLNDESSGHEIGHRG